MPAVNSGLTRAQMMLTGAVAATALAIAAGCGGSSTADSSAPAPAPSSAAAADAFCGSAQNLGSIQAQLVPLANMLDDPAGLSVQLKKVQAKAERIGRQAPARLQDDIAVIDQAMTDLATTIEQQQDSPGDIPNTIAQAMQSPKLTAAYNDIQSWVQDNC